MCIPVGVNKGLQPGWEDTGMRNLPHHAFDRNRTWLELSLIAEDHLCWIRLLCLTGKLARAEPKSLRYRLLHAAGRLVRHGRRSRLRPSRLAMGHSARRSVHPAATPTPTPTTAGALTLSRLRESGLASASSRTASAIAENGWLGCSAAEANIRL